MKSTLFTRILVPSEKFAKTVKQLSELSEECLSDFAVWFNNLKVEPRRLDPAPQFPIDTVQALCIKSSVTTDEFWELMDHAVDISRDVFTEKDTLQNIVDDMVAYGLVNGTNAKKLVDFYEKVLPKGMDFARRNRRNSYERGEIAGLSDLAYDVDLRFIPDKVYDPENIKIEDYQPKGAEMIPVAIIGLELVDDIRKTQVSFQVNFSELEDLIVRLQACQKEMRLVSDFGKKFDISSS